MNVYYMFVELLWLFLFLYDAKQRSKICADQKNQNQAWIDFILEQMSNFDNEKKKHKSKIYYKFVQVKK